MATAHHKSRRRNPEDAAASMYAAFHGKPSEEIVEFEEQEHFHENLAGLGVLVELRVRTVTGLDRSFGFDTADAATKGNPLFGWGGDKHTYSAKSKSYSIKYRGFDLHRDPNNPNEYSIPKIAKGEWFDLKSAKREVDAVLADKKRMAEVEKREKAEKVGEAAAEKKAAIKEKAARKSESVDYRGYRISGSDADGFKVSGLGGKFYSLKIAKEAIDYRKAGVSDSEIAKAFRNPRTQGPVSSALKFAGDVSGLNYISRQAGKLDKRAGKAIGYSNNPDTPPYKRFHNKAAAAKYAADIKKYMPHVAGPKLSYDGLWTVIWSERPLSNSQIEAALNVARINPGGNTSTSTDAHSPTSTEVRSPTRTATSTSTDAYTSGNVTVTGGAGAGANTRVSIFQQKPTDPKAKTAGVRRGVRANPEPISTSTTLLTCNEEGTQLYFVGGDQSLDLDALKFSEIEQEKDLVTIGDCFFVSYLTQKDFDDMEVICYEHELGEESGVMPQLIYDTRNKRLMLSGGEYHIQRPMFETSPGIEN